MSEPKNRTRPPTTVERLAARTLGRLDPVEVVEDVTPSAAVHAARLAALRESAKPKGMGTAAWYAHRARGGALPEETAEGKPETIQPLPG